MQLQHYVSQPASYNIMSLNPRFSDLQEMGNFQLQHYVSQPAIYAMASPLLGREISLGDMTQELMYSCLALMHSTVYLHFFSDLDYRIVQLCYFQCFHRQY